VDRESITNIEVTIMKRLMTMALAVALFGGASYTPLLAQGKGKAGQKGGGKGTQSGPQDGTGKQKGKQPGPQDGTGKQKGEGPFGKQSGPKDGTGPVDTPPKQ